MTLLQRVEQAHAAGVSGCVPVQVRPSHAVMCDSLSTSD